MSTESLGYKLRRLRLDHKLPLRKVAALLDMDVAILSKMERGERKLTKDIVLKLADIYHHPADDLLIHFISDKILYEIGDESFALEALQAAEESIMYHRKNIAVPANTQQLNKEKIIQGFTDYFLSQDLVAKAYLFGSFARGDDNPLSDFDIAIDVLPEKRFTFFDLLEIQENLQKIASRKVDVVMINSLRPLMRSKVEKDKILIYEA